MKLSQTLSREELAYCPTDTEGQSHPGAAYWVVGCFFFLSALVRSDGYLVFAEDVYTTLLSLQPENDKLVDDGFVMAVHFKNSHQPFLMRVRYQLLPVTSVPLLPSLSFSLSLSLPPSLPPSLSLSFSLSLSLSLIDLSQSSSKSVEKAKVLFEYEADNPDELTIKLGEIVEIVNKTTDNDGWWEVSESKRG